MTTKTLDAATHERLRAAMAPFSPSRDDGAGPVPADDQRMAARALRGRWDPAHGDVREWAVARARPAVRRGMVEAVLSTLAARCWPLFRLAPGAR